MRNGVRVIDADAHVMEPDDMWARYIDPKYRDRAPRRSPGSKGSWGQLEVDGVPIYRAYPPELVGEFERRIVESYADAHRSGFDAASHVRAMDLQGIDEAFLYPSLGLGVLAIDGQDPQLAHAISRAYNDWMSDLTSGRRGRLHGIAVVSMHDPADAVTELRRAVTELGFRAVTVRPNLVRGRSLGHPDFASFWALCEELDVAVGIHEGCHTKLPAAGADRFTTHLGMHTCCHPLEQMMAFVSLYESGTLQRHPRLRVGFMEAGCGWIPYLLWRMEGEYALWKFQVPHLKERPTETFVRQCFLSMEGCEPYLGTVIDTIGKDKLLFSSDYPHPDHGFGEELDEVLEAPVGDDVKRRILSDNAAAFYRC